MKSFIYLIYAEIGSIGQWKIGVTRRKLEERLREHKTSNPNIVGITAYYETDSSLVYGIESLLKRWYKRDIIEGEWIRFEAITKDKFLKDCQKIEHNFKFIKNNSTLI